MGSFASNALVKVQNFITSHNIDILKAKFIKKEVHEENLPVDIDHESGVITYYDAFKNEYFEVKFVNKLETILWELTNELKAEIDASNIFLSSKAKVKYWQSVLDSFDYIKEKDPKIIERFPICLKVADEIKLYLESKYHFNQPSQFESGSYFTLKPKYKIKDLKQIFQFLTENLYLDDELYSYEDFYEVLNSMETRKILVFNCNTQALTCILDKFSDLFTDLSRRKIEESGRFFTKNTDNRPSALVTINILDTNMNRIKDKENYDLNIIRKFFSDYFA
jgi:hypothetical protein